MKIHQVEGNLMRLDGGAMFGNAPKPLWSKWHTPDDFNRIHLATRTLLLQTDKGRNILFETGIGTFFDPKMKERFGVSPEAHLLVENLKKIGLKEGDIDDIVLSHLHFDHAGGLLSTYSERESPKLLFPKAKYYVGKQHWTRANNPHMREQASFIPALHKLLIDSGRLQLFDGSSHPDLPDFISFRYSNGHTIGLAVAVLHLDNPLAFVSDLIPGMAWVHLPIVMGYDRFPELTVDEKTSLLKFLAENKGSVYFTHDPKVSFAEIQADAQTGKFKAMPKVFQI